MHSFPLIKDALHPFSGYELHRHPIILELSGHYAVDFIKSFIPS